MVISILIMLSIMFANVFSAFKYRNRLGEPEIKDKYGFIYEGQRKDNLASTLFLSIFMVRRIFFVMIIILLQDYSGMQLILNTLMTKFYIIYMMFSRPFAEAKQNTG